MFYLNEIIFSCDKKKYNLFVNKKRKIYNFMQDYIFEVLAENNL
jgi:hypothetical protein